MLRHIQKQRGFTLTELLVVIVIIGALVGIALSRMGVVGPESRAKVIADHVGDIVTATRGWRGFNKPYTGVSIRVLTQMGKLPTEWGDGTGANPSQGSYTVAAANPSSQFTVTATGLENEVCLNTRNHILVGTLNGNSATCANNGTLSATYK